MGMVYLRLGRYGIPFDGYHYHREGGLHNAMWHQILRTFAAADKYVPVSLPMAYDENFDLGEWWLEHTMGGSQATQWLVQRAFCLECQRITGVPGLRQGTRVIRARTRGSPRLFGAYIGVAGEVRPSPQRGASAQLAACIRQDKTRQPGLEKKEFLRIQS
jgi:hypothetical protein